METRHASIAEPAAPARPRPRLEARLRGLDLSRLGWPAFALLALAMAVFVFHETRGTTVGFDEWTWAVERRGGGVGAFLEPHNQHLSLVPVAIYKLLFATTGIDDYTAFRVVIIAGHALVGALLFAYARRRVGDFAALLVVAVFLFFGPAWQNFMWGFQIAWLVALSSGIGALMLLERRDRAGDVGASALLGVALASAGVGVPIVLGVACDVLLSRRRWKQLWIVAVPVALYAIWWLGYQEPSEASRHSLVLAPRFVADAVGATVAALTGLGASAVPERPGLTLEWATPLAIAAVAALVWRLRRLGGPTPRMVALLVIVGSFFTLTALSRVGLSLPHTSRYLYVGALFGLLLVCELARGTRPSPRVGAVLAVAAGIVLVTNVGVMRDAGRYLRGDGAQTAAATGAVEIARPVVDPAYVIQELPGYPFVSVRAADLYALQDDIGSPAATPAEIAASSEPVRRKVDAELIRMHRVDLPEAATRAAGAPPALDQVAGGAARPTGSCVDYRPRALVRTGEASYVDVTVPPRGLVLTAVGGNATVSLRRFAEGYGSQQAVGRIGADRPTVLRIAGDRDPRPWHVRLTPSAGARACGL